MRCSPKGRKLIQDFEGCRHTVYLDFAGKPTIGYGHYDPALIVGQTYSQEQIDALFDSDISKCESAVDGATVPVILSQNQFDALVSFTFNVGIAALAHSTLALRVRQGRFEHVPEEFLKWNKIHNSKGELVESPILTDRRTIEAKLWSTHDGAA